jgi:hypothetical protein
MKRLLMPITKKNGQWDGITISKIAFFSHLKLSAFQDDKFPLYQVGEIVEVQGMALEDECMREVFVEITW